MLRSVLAGLTGLCLLQSAAGAAEPAAIAPPKMQEVAAGAWLIQGLVVPDRQPDGNTVILRAPQGLIVMDTGRHAWHRQTIADFARGRRLPIVAIVNSHWHLDHVSGDPYLKRAWPHAKIYASRAIDGAITGFLPDSAAEGRKYLDDASLPAATREDLRNDLATIANAGALRPDVPIEASGVRDLGGRRVRLNLAPDAATAGDVWLYDPATRIAVVGDLVTLPAPYLDTACPTGWKTALGEIWKTPFETVIPGHGKPMTRAGFALYRRAFEAMIDCSASGRTKAECGAGWARDAAPLLQFNGFSRKGSARMAEYYVGDVLRAHGGRSRWCRAA